MNDERARLTPRSGGLGAQQSNLPPDLETLAGWEEEGSGVVSEAVKERVAGVIPRPVLGPKSPLYTIKMAPIDPPRSQRSNGTIFVKNRPILIHNPIFFRFHPNSLKMQ